MANILFRKENISKEIQKCQNDIKAARENLKQIETYINFKNRNLTNYLEDYFKDSVIKLINEMKQNNTPHLNVNTANKDKHSCYIQFHTDSDSGWNIKYESKVTVEIKIKDKTIVITCLGDKGNYSWDAEVVDLFITDMEEAISYINEDCSLH